MSHNKTEWRGRLAAGPRVEPVTAEGRGAAEDKLAAVATQHCVDIVTGQTVTTTLRAWHSAYTTKEIPHNR